MTKFTKIAIFLIITTFVMGMFLACKPNNEDDPTSPPTGDSGDSGDGGASTQDDLKDVQYRDMIDVTGGTFTQEPTFGNNFEHTISNGFSIGKYEVTYELWHIVRAWASNNGYAFANSGNEGNDGTAGVDPTDAKYEPVTMVNWRDAIVWCNAYSEIEGDNPVYKFGGSVLRDSRDDNATACDGATMEVTANGYRLPTEGEWQFVASNKGDTPYNYASGATADVDNASACYVVAWYYDNSNESTHAVGGKNANALNLHDMAGNVWEWCWDWYGDYPSGAQTDYVCSNDDSSKRISRSGGWRNNSSFLRVGYRYYLSPDYEHNHIGLRVVRRP